MTELTYFKSLSAIFYVIIAVMYYRKMLKILHTEKSQEFEELCRELDMDEQESRAVSKTALLIMCLFWPVSVLLAAYKQKGDRK